MEKQSVSTYLDYLPAYLQTDPFLGRFLLAFERILTGFPEEDSQFYPQIIDGTTPRTWGLETIIANLHTYFDPQQTPSEFLPWLAGWVALSLRDNWDEKTKRQFISQIVPLYQIRGTVPGMKKMLEIYLESSGLSYPDRTIAIFEFDDRPHYFQVQLALPSNQVINPERYWREFRIAKGIIDQEKPAHTYYALRILTLTMQITQAWGVCYPFWLFDSPPQQKFQLEATIQLDGIPAGDPLEKEILIRIQGKNSPLEPHGSQRGPNVRQTIFYQKFLGNVDGFFVALANLSDRQLSGHLTLQIHFNLNHHPYSHIILDRIPFDLEPNLRIYRPLNQLESMPGNTRLDANLAQTLQIATEPPLSLYQARITPIDGNSDFGYRTQPTMRLVHDARLRIFKPRPLYPPVGNTTRLGSKIGDTLQIPDPSRPSDLRVYQKRQEYRIGNTRLGPAVGHTMRLVPNSQWLERLFRFRLFDLPAKQKIQIEALIELQGIAPEDLQKIAMLITVRIQACTSKFMPLIPEIEITPQGIRATHSVSYKRFLAYYQGFYFVLSNVNDCQVSGQITIQLNFNLNQKPISQVIHIESFTLSTRVNILEICDANDRGEITGNTIIGRVTPRTLRESRPPEEAWVD